MKWDKRVWTSTVRVKNKYEGESEREKGHDEIEGLSELKGIHVG